MSEEELVTRGRIFGRKPTIPPDNELPALLGTEPLVWRSEHTAVAVLGLECYTTGVEFTVIGRTRDQQVMTMLRSPRFAGDVISGRGETDLRFSVFAADELARVDPLGSRTDGQSFRCRGWIPVANDLTFALAWPVADIEYGEHEVTGVRATARRAMRLWSG